MRKEVAHGDGLGGRPQFVGAGCRIERLQHHRLGKFWKKFRHWIVEGKATLFDELHGGDRVTGLVIEAMRNSASNCMGRASAMSATPNAP